MNATGPTDTARSRWPARRLCVAGLFGASALVTLLPVMLLGFGVGLHDGRIHQIWSGQFAEAFLEVGGYYPRWLRGLNDGLGSPTMFFYPVLPYLPTIPGHRILGVGHLLAFGVLVSATIAGFAMQRLLQQFVQRSTSLAGAALYVTAPYYLGTDLYTRGAYAEYWAFAWMPLVLLGVMKVRKGVSRDIPIEIAGRTGTLDAGFPFFAGKRGTDTRLQSIHTDQKSSIPVNLSQAGATNSLSFRSLTGTLLLATGYGALVATHLPTTLVFSLVPLALAAVPVGGRRWLEGAWVRWRPLAFTGLGMAFGAGLAASYLLPAMTMQEHVSMAALTSFHQYNHNFFFGELGWRRFDLGHEFKQTLYLPFLATAVMGGMGFLLARSRPKNVHQSRLTVRVATLMERKRMGWFFLTVLGTSVFMMLPLSDFMWRLLPHLQIIQFPWRICSILTLSAVILVALGLDGLCRPLSRQAAVQLSFLVVAIAGGLGYSSKAIWKFVETSPHIERAVVTKSYNMDAPEYRPRWAKQNLRTTIQIVRRPPANLERERGTTNGLAWVDLPTRPDDPLIGAQSIVGSAELSVMEWRSRRLRLACVNRQPATLRIGQLYFPGWTARRDGKELPLRPSEPAGLIEIDVPAGNGYIEMILEPLWPEKVGNRVGLVCASIWLGCVFWARLVRKPVSDTRR